MMSDLELERWWTTPFNRAGNAASQIPVASTAPPQLPPSQARPVKSPLLSVTLQTALFAPLPESQQLELHLTVALSKT
jgi:hypothetical protein